MRILSALVLGGGVLLLSSCDPFSGISELGICDSLHGLLGRQTVTAVASEQEEEFNGETNALTIVSLVPVTGGNGGKASMMASSGEHYFFMNDVPLAVADSQGNVLPVSDCPLSTVSCSGAHYDACRRVTLPRDATYHLDFGPTDATHAFLAIRGL